MKFIFTGLIILSSLIVFPQPEIRRDILLEKNWRTAVESELAFAGAEESSFNDQDWKSVEVPHNWDTYEGYRRLRHGNRHGTAWYRNKFSLEDYEPGKRCFLFFEGVGSYATVWVNGKHAGHHEGGRTTFTLDITALVVSGKDNLLVVQADHPSFIKDLPWVCGGCSDEIGFSEGSQPMGIFRPVHLIITNEMRIEPFGIHIWNDTTVSERSASINISAEIKNYGSKKKTVTITHRLLDKGGNVSAVAKEIKRISPGETVDIRTESVSVSNPHLWSTEDPYLYTLVSEISEKGHVIDRVSTPYGIRWIKWDIGPNGTNRFYVNGKSVFINGTAEYEHLMGRSHAFSDEQVRARAMQVKASGFNAFRDAHQPHNLRYQKYWNELGILWWTQFTAHIWFDTPEFRANFKTLLKDWVKERRNDPSLILWGLQNESHLPEDFARECTAIIRQLDPTTSSQRKVTTCNGGGGTDWNVPQNWTGTYGGDPSTYADDIQRQVLVGEYGGWRSIDYHTFSDEKNGLHSEEELAQLLETKVRLAESVKDKCSGHFNWLFSSHENPGRVQAGEGLREMDRVGPVNYKGLFTAWGEPLDVFYMYRANYAPKETEPMAYIVSHTWTDRWTAPGIKDSIIVYSNCDSVELFNDVHEKSLGTKINSGRGTHFQWDQVAINDNVLYAVGYVNGKEAAQDYVVLKYLPESPHFKELLNDKRVFAPQDDANNLYRVNCGGGEYKDRFGHTWMTDVHKKNDSQWGSLSWTDDFDGMSPFYASQRRTSDPIGGTSDWPLVQTFRYGMDRLRYDFPVKNGAYDVELYFIEPWYGTGGGMDCTGWRLFDVAVNGDTVLKDLDIWKEAGHDKVLKKIVHVNVSGGMLSVHFPRVKAGQAVISAIAIATREKERTAASPAEPINDWIVYDSATEHLWSFHSWLDKGDKPFEESDISFTDLPPELYGATWIRTPQKITPRDPVTEFKVTDETNVYIGWDTLTNALPAWLNKFEDTHEVLKTNDKGVRTYRLFRKRFSKGEKVTLGTTGDDGNMYPIILSPATTMVPAIDLRPVDIYMVEKAITDGVTSGKVLDRDCITLMKEGGSIAWNVSFGVASLYALRFRYFHSGDQPLKARLKIFASDNTLIREEMLAFMPPGEPKWKILSTSTGTMINAGNYRIVLETVKATGLSIRNLEIQ